MDSVKQSAIKFDWKRMLAFDQAVRSDATANDKLKLGQRLGAKVGQGKVGVAKGG